MDREHERDRGRERERERRHRDRSASPDAEEKGERRRRERDEGIEEGEVRENGEDKVRCSLCFVLAFHEIAVTFSKLSLRRLFRVSDWSVGT